ncbi:MAG TPA: hypothetical protein VFY38_04500, partial [Pseudonocardia sp.]|nr:hypothetical protein [Pseudonocardia sp.]
WYATSGVRTGVRRMFRDETDQGKVFFPDALVPYLAHDAVRELPPPRRRELALRHLYQFLLATTHVETRIVNRTAELVADGRSGVELPYAARLDAFKVYCDEGYHSLRCRPAPRSTPRCGRSRKPCSSTTRAGRSGRRGTC